MGKLRTKINPFVKDLLAKNPCLQVEVERVLLRAIWTTDVFLIVPFLKMGENASIAYDTSTATKLR